MRNVLLIFVLGAGLCLGSCGRHSSPDVSFYYWRSQLNLTKNEINTLRESNVNVLYVRYFDLKVNEQGLVVPESPLRGNQLVSGLQIIPVVYIKNSVFEHTVPDSIPVLAHKTVQLIREINSRYHFIPHELQFDCDWTLTTRDRFFYFLRACKRQYPVAFSATIRLHQVKFASRTGVPPVEKGMLMYYNMGTLASDTLNSIYDRKLALKYIQSLHSYALPLDVALPVYSWGVRIRSGRVTQLLSKVHLSDFKDQQCFRQVNDAIFETTSSCFVRGYYFKQGDRIKIEYTTADELMDIANDFSQHTEHIPSRIVFFDLDTHNMQHYEKKTFQKVANSFN